MRENVGSCIGVSAGASRGAGARAAKLYFPEFLNSDIDGKYIDSRTFTVVKLRHYYYYYGTKLDHAQLSAAHNRRCCAHII